MLKIYDALGRRVATLVEEVASVGEHAVRWNGVDERGRAVASGVYFYVLEIGADAAMSQQEVRKMVLLR